MSETAVRRITWRASDVVRVLSLVALFLFAWKFFWMVVNALFLGLIAVLIAIVLYTPAQLLSRWMPFRVSFALVLFAFLGGLIGLFIAVIPQIVEQVTQLATQLPSALESVTAWVEARTGAGRDSELAQRVTAELSDFIGRFVPLAFNLISVVFASFAIIILAVFLAVQPQVYRDLFLRVAAPPDRERWERIYDEAGRSVRLWVIGKALTMLAIGVFVWVGLTLFGIPGALALASLAALLEFIPNFGPTIAAAPAIIAAFSISPGTALYVAIYYFILQQVQSAVTVPLVERRAVDIPPAALLMWQLMLAFAFGILGLFVATPLLAMIVVAVRILYFEPMEERFAWDRRDGEPGVLIPPDPPEPE